MKQEIDNKRTPRLYYDEHKNKFYFIIKNEKVYIPLHNTKQEGTNNFKQIGKTIINILHNKNAHFKVKSRRRKKPMVKRIITSHQISSQQIPTFIQTIPNYTQFQTLGNKIGFYEPIQSIPSITKEQEVQKLKEEIKETKQEEQKVKKEIDEIKEEIKQEEKHNIPSKEEEIKANKKIPLSAFKPNLKELLEKQMERLNRIIMERDKQYQQLQEQQAQEKRQKRTYGKPKKEREQFEKEEQLSREVEKLIREQEQQQKQKVQHENIVEKMNYLREQEQQKREQEQHQIEQEEEEQYKIDQEQLKREQEQKQKRTYGKPKKEREQFEKEEKLSREVEKLIREQEQQQKQKEQQQKKRKIFIEAENYEVKEVKQAKQKIGYKPTAPLDDTFLVDKLQKDLDVNQKQTEPIDAQPVETQPVEPQTGETQPLPFVPEQPLNTVGSGAGLIERVSNWFKGVHKLPHSVMAVLNHYGNAEVTGITIGRKPLNSVILKFANAISSQPYDKLFHLYAIIKTTEGPFTLEKESTIRLIKGERYTHSEGFEYMNVNNIQSGLTLSKMLEQTEKRMGETKFIQYSAYSSNCQDFLYNVMKSNGINDNTILSFIKQDTKAIFKNNPTIRKLVNTTTDTHAVLYGTGEYEGDGKYSSFTDGLYDDEIQEIMKDDFNKFCPVIMSDQIPTLFKYIDCHTKQFGFIINTENSHQLGEHWIGIFIDVPLGEVCIYNSLADAPTKTQIKGIRELVKKINPPYLMKLKWNHIKTQNNYSNNCGFYALRFVEQMYNGIKVNLGNQTGGVKDNSINGEKSIEYFKTQL